MDWRLDLCQFLTSCSGKGSKKAIETAFVSCNAMIFADSNDTKSDVF